MDGVVTTAWRMILGVMENTLMSLLPENKIKGMNRIPQHVEESLHKQEISFSMTLM